MDFKPIIQEQRKELEDISKQEIIIDREGLAKAKSYLCHPNILAVLGIRRSGKSIFSYLLAKGGNYGYINFDDERLGAVKTEDLNSILEAMYGLYGDVEYVVLDEVQNVDGWELFANRLRRTKKVILTGSNSQLLSGELATRLTGRYIDFVLLPFSFREYMNLKQIEVKESYTTQEKSAIIKQALAYIESGGFPEADKFGRQMLLRIYEDIITKDIIMRYKIRKIEEFKQFARYLVSNSGKEITYSKLAEIFKLKHPLTASKWVSYIENSFLLFRLERFSFKLKQQFIAPKKVYCIDTGIINTIGFKFSEDKGRLMENKIAVELRRKAYGKGIEIYYWKDHRQNEVDFVVKQGKKIIQLIQATYANERMDINERELKSLVNAGRELKCSRLSIITWDYSGTLTYAKRKVELIPLWKWLSMEK